MAWSSSVLCEEQFQCSICLDVFTEPVTTPCGHNYCKACITQHWDNAAACQCPLCNKTFHRRPEVSVNTFISGMADRFRKSLHLGTNRDSAERGEAAAERGEASAEPDEVSCDVCTDADAKPKALKSCLVCLTSYCRTHLEPHLRLAGLKRHKLIDPTKNLEDFICKKHDRPLELFCKTDRTCICQFCAESDHKSHRVVSLEEECEGRRAGWKTTEAEVQEMIRERQEKVQEVIRSVELGRQDADAAVADSVQVFTAMISCIQRSQAELMNVVEEKQKAAEKQAEDFIKDLLQEVAELEKKSSELKELSRTEDQLHLLHKFKPFNTGWRPTRDWTKANVQRSSHVGTVRTTMTRLEETLGREMEEKRCDTELRRIQRCDCVDVTLDRDTAHCKLILSNDGKQVSHGNIKKDLPDNAERFSRAVNVLGKRGYSSGRFYYEVRVAGKTAWNLGVARESVNRKGVNIPGPANGYWTVGLSNGDEYWANADPDVRFPVGQKVQRVGVFVDYEDGLVSFYDVEARVHLYSFTGCTFTEKLYPFFCPRRNDGGMNSAPLVICPVNQTD